MTLPVPNISNYIVSGIFDRIFFLHKYRYCNAVDHLRAKPGLYAVTVLVHFYLMTQIGQSEHAKCAR